MFALSRGLDLHRSSLAPLESLRYPKEPSLASPSQKSSPLCNIRLGAIGYQDTYHTNLNGTFGMLGHREHCPWPAPKVPGPHHRTTKQQHSRLTQPKHLRVQPAANELSDDTPCFGGMEQSQAAVIIVGVVATSGSRLSLSKCS